MRLCGLNERTNAFLGLEARDYFPCAFICVIQTGCVTRQNLQVRLAEGLQSAVSR